MNTYPFLIHQDALGGALHRLDLRTQRYDEKWLQELLRQQPDILPVAEIETIFSPLASIGREVSTDVGLIDNLFISHRGYLVLVETKLWRNPGAKREVVAQAIDYASSLSKWSYKQLNDVTKAYTKKYEQGEKKLFEWVEQQCGPIEEGREFFEEVVAKNLRLGRFLTVIVGDKIRHSIIEMLNYANTYPHLAMDVAMVELQCYHWNSKQEWPILVIPRVVSRTEIVERSIVQITVHQDGTYQTEVRQEKSQEEKKGRKRVTLTEEAFWELLQGRQPEAYDRVRSLIDLYQKREGMAIDPTEGAIVVRLGVQDTGQQISVFFVDKNAELCVWPKTIREQLVKKVGMSASVVDSYETAMRGILNMPKIRQNFALNIAEVMIEEFTKAVDTFCDDIQSADLEM